MQDGEELALSEAIGLARVLECGLGYLVAPTMQMVDPATNKGKRRRRELHDLLNATEWLKGWRRTAAEQALKSLLAGKSVTYASWRWACHNLKEAMEKDKPCCVRTTRMGAVV